MVIHEFPFSEPIFSDGCPCLEVYNSHNFELSLLSAIVGGPGFEEAYRKLMRLEGNLANRCGQVFATSELDSEKFRLFYGVPSSKLGLCPNGFDEDELSCVVAARGNVRATGGRAKCLFLGSEHYPNIDAARFLIEMALSFPEYQFMLAGGLCRSLADLHIPENVSLLGPIDVNRKHQLLAEVDVFLNPVTNGSGTSLKALEALGALVPLISTPEGVRGLDLRAGTDCEIVPRSEFGIAIRRVVADEGYSRALAASGREFVRKRFAWSTVAMQLDEMIRAPPRKEPTSRHLVLALNDYSVMSAGSGGASRIRGLLGNLDLDVVLVSYGDVSDIALISPCVLHVTVSKTEAHIAFEAAVNEGEITSVNDGVASLFVGSNLLIIDIICSLARRSNAVVFEHPYMAPVLDAIDLVRNETSVIYSSHNVEATHKAALLRKHRLGQVLTNYVAELERRLISRSHLVVCCTTEDAKCFSQLGAKKSIVVRNGCVLPDGIRAGEAMETVSGDEWRMGFLGSGHGPNVEAAEFIITSLAPHFPKVTFEFIGSVCTAVTIPIPANVKMHSVLTEVEKSAVMAGWHLALNPVESGGGSSLKVPDFLAHGLVTVSTPTGARGFELEESDAGYIVARRQLGPLIAKLMAAPKSLQRQAIHARKYAAEQLAWPVTTQKYRAELSNLFFKPSMDRNRRLLVVTYRYTEPTLGGAEEYLLEVLKRVRSRVARLDLAAVDIEKITNQHHFGCVISQKAGGASRRLGEIFDQTSYFAVDDLDEAEILWRSRQIERVWANEECDLYLQFAPQLASSNVLRLLGGFYWPENHDGVVRRWTSPTFNFLMPSKACIFQMSGYASREKTLRVELLCIEAGVAPRSIAQYQQIIPAHFYLSISIPAMSEIDGALVLRCKVDEHHALGDHRPFGVLLEAVNVFTTGEQSLSASRDSISPLAASSADLSENLEEYLRAEHFETWVSALVNTARSRDAESEGNFAAVRGPHSCMLQEWLVNNAKNYDCVLIQGIPFDVIPRTIETLSALPNRPRLVTLPHFHGDDRFYHWRRYFDSFASADNTLLFSSSIANRLGDASRFSVIPGGGVRSDEHGDTQAIHSFQSVHNKETPFFLCLGRKTSGKGYEQTVRVHQSLRSQKINVDLILIGPDEDGREISGEGVYYLGRQPRSVIRGALSRCIALVNMSRSESFGIVLCEAWLFGKPVIANRACYSFRELINHGKTGFLVLSDEELRDAMIRLTCEEGEGVRMGGAGFEKVASQFTWECVSETLLLSLFPR
jgi:glycosyltransferase involved in cell wall biosynthesis